MSLVESATSDGSIPTGGSTPSLATIFSITSLGKKAKMHRTSYSVQVMLVMVLGTSVALGQAAAKPASGEPTKTEDFATVGDIRLHYVADGDGTPDCQDGCPADAAKTEGRDSAPVD